MFIDLFGNRSAFRFNCRIFDRFQLKALGLPLYSQITRKPKVKTLGH